MNGRPALVALETTSENDVTHLSSLSKNLTFLEEERIELIIWELHQRCTEKAVMIKKKLRT